MNVDSERQLLADMNELLLWTRAANFKAVKSLLEETLQDDKSRLIYQLSDGTRSLEDIRKLCKTSPNAVSEIQQTCISMGIMTSAVDGKRVRLFDLVALRLVLKTAIPK